MHEDSRSTDAINLPDVVDEVTACFDKYDGALLSNDLEALIGWFWSSPEAVRYGIGEELYGADAIAGYRRAAPPVVRGPMTRRAVTTFGRDLATVSAEFDAPGGTLRQSQTWVRTEDGWRITAAHVSMRGSAD